MPADLREKFFEIFDRGSAAVAAREAGVNRTTAAKWVSHAGLSSTCPRRPHPRRGEYKLLREQGVSRREAAERVGVHVLTARDWDLGSGQRAQVWTRAVPGGRGS